jgi:effector-binding domain-containing protein
MTWIEGNGYRILGPHRELFLRDGSEQDNPDYITEIQFPVETADSLEERR